MTKTRVLLSVCFLSCIVVQSTGAYQQKQSVPLPVKGALTALQFPSGMPIDLSPRGEWVAYTLKNEQRRAPKDDPRYSVYTRTGAPVGSIGCDVWITNIKTGETKNITGGIGSSWGPVWSPNGERLALYSDRSGRAQVWLWEMSSRALRPLSDVIVRVSAAEEVMRWTADSAKLLVKVLPDGMTLEDAANLTISPPSQPDNSQGKEPGTTVIVYRSKSLKTQNDTEGPRQQHLDSYGPRFLADLALIEVSSGRLQRIVRGFRPQWYRFSPDGAQLAFTSHRGLESDKETQVLYDLIVLSLNDLRPRVVSANIRQLFGRSVSWSPDSQSLAYTTTGPRAKGDCYIVSVNGGTPRNLTPGTHPNFGDHSRAPLWAANGRQIYLLPWKYSPEPKTIWKASVAEGELIEIAKIPQHTIWEVIAPQGGGRFWSPDGGRSMVVVTRDNETKDEGFYKIDLTTGNHSKLVEGKNSYGKNPISMIDVSADGQTVVYSAQSAEQYESMWSVDRDFHAPRRVTQANPQLESYIMGQSRLIEWRDVDGRKLKGALLLPAGYREGKTYPLIVYQYPSELPSNYVNYFGLGASNSGLENMQLFATRGYAVLMPDMPHRGAGTVMQEIAKAVMPGVDKIIEMGIADPDRIGVMGHSYGGYGVLCLIVQTTRFKAAIDSAGPGNLIGHYTQMTTTGSSIYTGQVENLTTGGTLWEKRDKFIENSPVFYLDKVQTPLLIVQGTLDNAVSPFLSDEVFVALRRLGKEVEYAKYEGEAHSEGVWGYANQVDFCNRRIAWFDQWLKGRSEQSRSEQQ
jgi:dipeptidyl aminopeptidase/acylaminoacyl peptidase